MADGRRLDSILADDRGRFTLPRNVVSGFLGRESGDGGSRTTTGTKLVPAVTIAGYAMQRVMVAPGSNELTITLSRAVAISGRIADPNGEGSVDVRDDQATTGMDIVLPRGTAVTGTVVESIAIVGLDVTDTPFDFGAGTQTITGAEVVMSNAGAAISGHVTDAASSPVSSYSVVVFPTDRSRWFVTSRFLRLVRPMKDGSFEVTGLPPGEYYVAATDSIQGNDVSGDWLRAETLDRLSFRAARVTLAEKQRVMTVLRLIRR